MSARRFNIGTNRFCEGSRVVEQPGGAVRLSHNEYVALLQLCETGVFRGEPNRRVDNLIYRLRGKLGLEAQIVCDWKNGYRLLNATEAN